MRHQRLGLTELGAADADRAGGDLQLRDAAPCASWRAAGGQAVRFSAACIVAMLRSSLSRSTHSAGVSRSHFEMPAGVSSRAVTSSTP